MIVKWLSLILLVFSTALHAYDVDLLCSGKMSDRNRRKCHREYEKGRYYDSRAFMVCVSILDFSPKIHCIKAIRDHQFDGGAVGICSDLVSSSKSSCLELIKDKRYNSWEMTACRRNATSFFSSDVQRMNCLRRSESIEIPSTL